MIVLTGLLLFGNKRTPTFGLDVVWLLLMVLFIVGTGIATTYNMHYNISYFFRLLKIIVLVCSIFWLGKQHINYDYAVKVLKVFSLMSAVFIVLQSMAYYGIGIQIPGIFSPLAYDEGKDYVNFLNGKDSFFRPAAFFIEPANFAAYEFVFFCYLLSNPGMAKRTSYMVVTIIGLFFSTSGTAYAMIPVLFAFSYFFVNQNQEKKKRGSFVKGLLVTVFGMGLLVLLIFNTDIGANSVGRLFDSSGEATVAVTGRLESEGKELFAALPSDWKYWGCGFGYRPKDIYMPSYDAILFGDGYIGLVAVFLLIVFYFIKTSGFGKMLCMTFLALFFSSGVFSFAAIGLYFSFISKETTVHQLEKNTRKLKR